MDRFDPRRALQTILWLVAAHSVAVGLGLVLHPTALMAAAGYAPITEPFFPTQGGVFHFVVAVAYALAARDPDGNDPLVRFAIVVKVMATVFLVVYWLLHPKLLVVLGSGLVDLAMAVAIAASRRWWRQSAAE
jgi:hypothetical protein